MPPTRVAIARVEAIVPTEMVADVVQGLFACQMPPFGLEGRAGAEDIIAVLVEGKLSELENVLAEVHAQTQGRGLCRITAGRFERLSRGPALEPR